MPLSPINSTDNVQKLEEKIAQIKSEKEKVETELALPDIYNDQKVFKETLAKFNTIDGQLKEMNVEWEKVFEEMSELGLNWLGDWCD